MEAEERRALSNSLKADKALLIASTIFTLLLSLLIEAYTFTTIVIVIFSGLFYQLFKLHKHLSYSNISLYIKTRNGEVEIPLSDVTSISISSSVWFRRLWRIKFEHKGQSHYCYTYPQFGFITIQGFIKHVKTKNPYVDLNYIWIG